MKSDFESNKSNKWKIFVTKLAFIVCCYYCYCWFYYGTCVFYSYTYTQSVQPYIIWSNIKYIWKINNENFVNIFVLVGYINIHFLSHISYMAFCLCTYIIWLVFFHSVGLRNVVSLIFFCICISLQCLMFKSIFLCYFISFSLFPLYFCRKCNGKYKKKNTKKKKKKKTALMSSSHHIYNAYH